MPVFWVYGGNKQRFTQDYRKLAKKLDLLIPEDPEDDFRTVVREHLESLPDWILVVDNADDQASFLPSTTHSEDGDKDAQPLSMFLPQGARGTLIITTRDKEVATAICSRNIIQKSVMGPEHAMELFMNHYKEPRAESIPELLELLEYLPLAVVQAAKYMSDIMDPIMTPAAYIDDFKSTRIALQEPFCDVRREPGYETVLTTLALTFKLVETQSPIAFCILQAIGCVGCHHIPTRFLERIGETQGEDLKVKRALSKLASLALIKQTADAESYEMHRLTHLSLVQRLQTKEVEWDDTSALCYEVLVELLPGPAEYTMWSIWDQYIPHVNTLVNHGGANMEPSIILCTNAARFYMDRGTYFSAEEMCLRAREAARSVHGENHGPTLLPIHELARVYLYQSRLKEAEELFVRVLDAEKIVHGESHPNTLNAMHGLAQVYLLQSRPKEAEELYVQVLDVEKIILGKSHPDTLNTMKGLANTYHAQGFLDKATDLWDEVDALMAANELPTGSCE